MNPSAGSTRRVRGASPERRYFGPHKNRLSTPRQRPKHHIMRLAVVSTPRSGNTWLRGLLAGLNGLQQRAVHDPGEIDWAGLPDRSIVQVHRPRTEEFARELERDGVRVVTIARHPLDVLVSILHFSRREPNTRHWLLGEGDGEAVIRGAAPGDAAFEAFAKSPRASQLLAVTSSWWNEPGVIEVRYESLVSSPHPCWLRWPSNSVHPLPTFIASSSPIPWRLFGRHPKTTTSGKEHQVFGNVC